MKNSKSAILLLTVAAVLSMSYAKSVVHAPAPRAPKETKVGGLTAVLADMSWERSVNISSLEYRDESIAPPALSHDEPLCRLSIRNLLPIPRTLEISAQSIRSSTSKRTLTIGPTSTATVTLPLALAYEHTSYGTHSILVTEPVPPAEAGGQGRKTVDSIKLANRVSEYDESSSSSGSSAGSSLLLSDGITRDSILPAFKKDFNTLELRRKAEEWPRDFRAYLPFDAVCLAKEVESALPGETRTAIRAYELLGGSVLTMQDGAHRPDDMANTIYFAKKRRIGDLDVYGYRWGRHSAFAGNITKVPIKVGRSLPVGLLMVLLALVAVVVIPITVWYCAKKNKRLLLLVVVPGSALALTVFVAIIALAAYGTTPATRLQSVTILDPANRLAVTRGQFAVFSPVQVTGRVSIPSDMSFRLRGRANYDPLTANYGENCRLSGDWIKPLTAVFFDFERAERRSERLDVKSGADDAITVANLLGSPIAEGFVQLHGIRYEIPPLAPGEEASVKGRQFVVISTKPAKPPADELAALFFAKGGGYGRDWNKTLQIVHGRDKIIIPDGTYIVRLAGCPFVPSPLAEIETDETAESVVAGCMASGNGKEVSK